MSEEEKKDDEINKEKMPSKGEETKDKPAAVAAD